VVLKPTVCYAEDHAHCHDYDASPFYVPDPEDQHLKAAVTVSKSRLAVLERRQRSLGLNRALDEKNVGFAMLIRMGHRPGEALGVPERNGLVHPLPIATKKWASAGLGYREKSKKKDTYRKGKRKYAL